MPGAFDWCHANSGTLHAFPRRDGSAVGQTSLCGAVTKPAEVFTIGCLTYCPPCADAAPEPPPSNTLPRGST